MPDLNAYLATHYLTADPKPTKKRKRKHAATDGLLITDDDESGWGTKSSRPSEDDPVSTATVAGTSSEFRKAKKSNWTNLSTPAPKPQDSDAAAADAILSAAAAETAAAAADDDAAPVTMSDGTYAGLQSAAAVSAQLAARRRAEREAYEAERRAAGKEPGQEEEQEAVYRDATGRRIDVSMRREQARLAAKEKEDKERAAKDLLRGEKQAEEAARRREALEDAAVMPLARGKDDEEMNREMRERERWNDPMAQFVGRDTGGGKEKKGKGRLRRPLYGGACPPNRYGIRPGYRWDGVDRGNGFEAERFKAINRRERNKGLEYAWQMDE